MSVTTNNALEFSEEQGMILHSAAEFCRDKSDIATVRGLLDSESGFDAQVWQEMVDLGWLGLAIPEEFGGSGLGIGATVPLAESMGKSLLSTPFFSATLAAQALLRAGTTAQKERWLSAIASGTVCTLAMLDGEDWGAQSFSAQAEEVDGLLSLQGEKWYVQDAAVSEMFLVGVSLGGESALVIVERDQLPAEALTAHTLIDQTKRANRLKLDGLKISADQLLDPSSTAAALRDLSLLGALLVAAESTGATAACLDTIVEYLKTRKQFGKLIGSYQALKHPTVDILCAMDNARSFIYHAATVIGEGALDNDAEIACRMAKAAATDALEFAGDRAVQFHGGMGFTYECDAQLYIRRGQWARQQYGDAYHHRKRLAPLLLD